MYHTIIDGHNKSCETAIRLLSAEVFFKVSPLPGTGSGISYQFAVRDKSAKVLDRVIKEVLGEKYTGPIVYPMPCETKKRSRIPQKGSRPI